MSALYYVLGLVARINAGLWRHRVNFVPMNVLLLAILGFAGLASLQSALSGLRNGTVAFRTSAAEIHDSPDIIQSYVTVAGSESPLDVLESGNKGGGEVHSTPENSWSALLDRASQRALLVRRPGKVAGGAAIEVKVTGMLRPMDVEARRFLATLRDSVEGFPVETRYMLVVNEVPVDTRNSILEATAFFVVIALFGIASVKGNAIFQPTGRSPRATGKADEGGLRVVATASFTFDQVGRPVDKRFNSIPAILGPQDDGNLGLQSNVDASNRFMGFTTNDRSGIWSVSIEAGSVQTPNADFSTGVVRGERRCGSPIST